MQPSFQATRAEPNFRNCGKGARPLGGHYACTMRPQGSRKKTMRPLCGHYASTKGKHKKVKNCFCHQSGRRWPDLDDTSGFASWPLGPYFGQVWAPEGPKNGPKNTKTLNFGTPWKFEIFKVFALKVIINPNILLVNLLGSWGKIF